MRRTDDELYDEVPKGFCTCESVRNCETATEVSRMCMKCIARGNKRTNAEQSEKYCLEQHGLDNNSIAGFMGDLTQKTGECNSHIHDDSQLERIKRSWDEYLSYITFLQKIFFPNDKGVRPDDVQ